MYIRRIQFKAAVIGALVLTGASACTVSHGGSAQPAPAASESSTIEWVTDPESNADHFLAVTLRGDGHFRVGDDFPAGTYSSAGPRTGAVCNWRRLLIRPDGSREIVGSGGGNGSQIVVIAASDTAFESDYCQPWRKSA